MILFKRLLLQFPQILEHLVLETLEEVVSLMILIVQVVEVVLVAKVKLVIVMVEGMVAMENK